MSGIAGLFRRDGAPVRRDELTCMLASLAHRGPDGCGAWLHESVALGHQLLWTTPESLHEQQPVIDSSGTLVLIADARIDNRDELIRLLDLQMPAATLSDSALILAAYAAWGYATPQHLLGDFAFAVWDASRQTMFCATDPMGVRGFFYSATPGLFAFASELTALVRLPDLEPRLNETRVGDYLMGVFDSGETTFFAGVSRMRAASTLTVSAQDVRIQRYWAPDPKAEVRFHSDDDYAEAFKAIFDQAVKARMRSAHTVGTTLSGGLDSSSITCTARTIVESQKLHTFSLVFPSLPQTDLRVIDERPHINAVLRQRDVAAHLIRADELSPMQYTERIHDSLGEPNGAPNLYLHWAIFQCARKHDVRVVLDGFDGDSAVSHGYDRLSDLARSMRWWLVWREVNMLARHQNSNRSRKDLLRELCLKPLLPGWTRPVTRMGLMDPAVSKRIGADARAKCLSRELGRWTTSARFRHARSVHDGIYAHTLSVADRASARFGVEVRYPFFDRRLIEFCVGLPPEQKLGQGWSRLILRRAMGGVLPDEVRWRHGKGDLSPNFRRGLLGPDRPRLDQVIEDGIPPLGPYVDSRQARLVYRRLQDDPARNAQDAVALFAAVNLALWLDSAHVTA